RGIHFCNSKFCGAGCVCKIRHRAQDRLGAVSGEKLRIFWVKANKLLPVHSGGDIRSFNIARQLARRHELTFFSYYDGKPDQEYEGELAKHFPNAMCFCTGKTESSSVARGMDYVAHLASSFPYAVGRFGSADVRQKISHC